MKKEISFFLEYSYFANFVPKIKSPKVFSKFDFSLKGLDEIKSEFYFNLMEVIEKSISKYPKEKKIVVPLSGGLDSRAILCALLSFLEKDRIITYTFGVPGSYDFEIGKEIARVAGVINHPINLKEEKYTISGLKKMAKLSDYQTFLFHNPPVESLQRIIEDNVVFSGYLGDLIFGSYSQYSNIKDSESINWYLEKERSRIGTPINGDYLKKFIEPIDSKSIISPVEQLILYERAPKLTAPHILLNGINYELPLIDYKIAKFMFSLPRSLRLKQKLFIEAMMQFFPKLFSMRSKTTYGKPLKTYNKSHLLVRSKNKLINSINRNLKIDLPYPPRNYMNFDSDIIHRTDFSEIFHSSLSSLQKRDILGGIKPLEIYSQHEITRSLSMQLINLVSLEIILQARDDENSISI